MATLIAAPRTFPSLDKALEIQDLDKSLNLLEANFAEHEEFY